MTDLVIQAAADQILRARDGPAKAAVVASFFDETTCTASHVVHAPASLRAAVIDPVLDFDPAAARTSTASADRLIGYLAREKLSVDWLLETHVHADHLSASAYLQEKVGGKVAIGRDIITVQTIFGKLFNAGYDFARDGSQFDRLLGDGERFAIDGLEAMALHVPGHTPADLAFVIGDAVFVGDTLFMPDYGTARADFPGGDARQLYRSIRRLLTLPPETRLFLCHDYKAPGRREFVWQSTVGDQRAGNVHVRDGIGEDAFVEMRIARDRTLDMPRIIFPSVQVNMRAGHLPPPETNGIRYLKLPLNAV